jgi:hypothetical protein
MPSHIPKHVQYYTKTTLNYTGENKMKPKKQKHKDFIIGSLEKVIENSEKRKCRFCGKDVWFSDTWTLQSCIPICINCAPPESQFVITPETVQNLIKEMEKMQQKDEINYPRYVG